MTVSTIPTRGFARGSVVRPCGQAGPNMLVVRGQGERTVVVVCAGDADGTLRMRDPETDTLELVVAAVTPGEMRGQS